MKCIVHTLYILFTMIKRYYRKDVKIKNNQKNASQSKVVELTNDVSRSTTIETSTIYLLSFSAHVHTSEHTKCANAYASIGSYFRNLISQHIPKLSDNIHTTSEVLCMHIRIHANLTSV